MNVVASRSALVALAAAVVLLAAATLPALACGDKDEACSCGAAAAQAAEQKADATAPAAMPASCADSEMGCACPQAAAAAAAAAAQKDAASADANAKAAVSATNAGAHQQAVVDPATGKLVAPKEGAGVEASGQASAPGKDTEQIAQPDGSVMAAFPADRTPKAVATVDHDGATHMGCSE